MDVKPKQCPACKSFYNELVYSSCPHCQRSEADEKDSVVKGFWSGWTSGRKNKSKLKNRHGNDQKEIPPTAEFPGEENGEVPPTIGFPGGGSKDLPPTTGFFRGPSAKAPAPSPSPARTSKEENGEILPATGPFFAKQAQGSSGSTLQQGISQRGRTIGKYFSSSSGEGIDPVVGWLVCVKGIYYGQSFHLKSGKNRIGRSHEMDVKLLNDQSVSRSCQATVIYDTKAGDFSIVSGESDSLCYVNGKALYERVVLSGYEEIEFGDSEKNQFVFIPLCGEHFKWSSYESGKEKGNFNG